MFQHLVRATVPLLLLTLPLLAGCRGRTGASEAPPEKARETIRQGLDAWKSGKTANAIKSGDSIIYSDSDLESGAKLLNYEVQGDGAADGFDWQMKVKLTLQDSSGTKSEKRAVYNVSTSPKRVIVRKEM